MSGEAYLAFVALAVVVIVAPGADFAVVMRNTLTGGRSRGLATASGITVSNLCQGLLAAAGLGAVIVSSEPLFAAIKWAGVCYLLLLAAQALLGAYRGEYAVPAAGAAARGFRQGFLTNLTNPKILVFYLAVLPQFISPAAPMWALVLLASTHALISLVYLVGLVVVMDRASRWLRRRAVRRGLDILTGTALAAISVRIAME